MCLADCWKTPVLSGELPKPVANNWWYFWKSLAILQPSLLSFHPIPIYGNVFLLDKHQIEYFKVVTLSYKMILAQRKMKFHSKKNYSDLSSMYDVTSFVCVWDFWDEKCFRWIMINKDIVIMNWSERIFH